MADHTVGARDDSHESEASQALMFCFDIVFQESLASLLSIWSLCFALPLGVFVVNQTNPVGIPLFSYVNIAWLLAT